MIRLLPPVLTGTPPRLLTGRVRRWLPRLVSGTTAAGVALAVVPLAGAFPAAGPQSAVPPAAVPATSAPTSLAGSDLELVGRRTPGRVAKRYRVRPGDTPSSIAVRYHAWTAELIARTGPTLYTGEVIWIPVVRSAQRACTRHRHHHTNLGRRHATKAHHPRHHATKPKRSNKPKYHGRHSRHLRGWHHADADRPQVRRAIADKARRQGVNRDLALAIAWQESGWQQRQISSAGALGAMQIMPATGRWISELVGRRLNPRDLYHNARTGVRLIRILRTEARPRVAIAGYYQGLAGVRRDGMYPSTKEYVASVMALKKRIARGWLPR
ncbi:hypothetical protein BH18ACT9_BH18ACT9_21840 [soil metagenome]